MSLFRSFLKRCAFSLLLLPVCSFAADAGLISADSSLKHPYQATATRINDLVHTRLEVRFDYAKHYLYGKEWVSVKPHFYDTDSLALDAKGMDIIQVSLMKGTAATPLRYTYDSKILNIKLPVKEKATGIYTVYIAYTAKPDELKSGGSAAINSDKGLYFINSDGKDPEKPIQIWTQGETESSSCWFPTIDKPNQKTTDEISMTVPAKYVTLSNGRLALSRKNTDGTRTDTWKMELPHAPYLMMMAVGDFKIYHDHWKNMPVDYYMEPKFAPYAKQIFGHTPEMIDFFSKTLGVDYPWNKYAQIVVRDYVSGAMENTTATLHGESVQRTSRELLDDSQEDFISHELFHQWFGDYATCESWSNITCNESFAAFSEIIWNEFKYGKEKADEDRYIKMHDYLNSFPVTSPELVRFQYKSREDVFDLVSYNKGAVILYMLRDLIGKEAFYHGLHIYLKNNAFKATEAQQLRLSFEEATGQDLNWFFNQWYYKGGQPVLNWDQQYNSATKQLTLHFSQVQDSVLYRIPLAIDIYSGTGRERKQVLLHAKQQTFTFSVQTRPDLINPDPEHVLVGMVNPVSKSLKDYGFQYAHGLNYIDRLIALDTCLKSPGEKESSAVILAALKDKNSKIRTHAIEGIKPENLGYASMLPLIVGMADIDPDNLTRAAALESLAKSVNPGYESLFRKGLTSQSLAIDGAALQGLMALNPDAALAEAEKLSQQTSPKVLEPVSALFSKGGLDKHASFFEKAFTMGPEKFSVVFFNYLTFLVESKNTTVVKKGIELLKTRILALHNKDYSHSLQQAFANIGKTKITMAGQSAVQAEKDAYTLQSESFSAASEELKEKGL